MVKSSHNSKLRAERIQQCKQMNATKVLKKVMGSKAFLTGQNWHSRCCVKQAVLKIFGKIHRKTRVKESLFKKFIKKDSNTCAFL